jgi:putative ABC transport system permease protein
VLFYALVALSVVLAVLGIVNTLTLSLRERTHELGLLRVIGLTPDQARAMFFAEGMITATIGTVAGVVLGWIITRPLTDEGISFAVPGLEVVALLVAGLAVGACAALGPATRAARLDVLGAIAYE